ncbi:MAG: N-acetyltransferase [Alphaproteobacteria bacterium]|nr:N-acetyltransferase [Alphaproteobacteria bacterium]
MVTIRAEIPSDFAAREALLNKAFGVKRMRKTSEKLRKGRLPAQGLAFSAINEKGKLVGTVRLWNIIAGSAGPALLLGPLAVDEKARGAGLGSALMRHALAEAARLGHGAVLLVGDAPYYARFGFAAGVTQSLHLPGPVERARFLGLELSPGALDGAEGLVAASGRLAEAEKAAA